MSFSYTTWPEVDLHASYRIIEIIQGVFKIVFVLRTVGEYHSRREVQKSEKLLGDLISLIKQCFLQTDGNGWNLPKMHALAKMPKNMLKFGTANNFCGQIGERALKGIVKDQAQLTQ